MNEIIKQGKLEDGIYFLPQIELDRKKYIEVAKHLEFLGGKWNRGKKGFIFDREIESIDELLGDNIKKKKDLQFFETPEFLADRLVELAEFKNFITILEPSAGRGRIIKSIYKGLNNFVDYRIDYCEIDETNKKYIDSLECEILLMFKGNDFLELELLENKLYDRIIANPPFAKNQDVEHIKHMYKLLASGGILVSIASKHWQLSSNKKETEFRQFLEDTSAEIIELDGGEFKESGTMIQGVIIKISK